MSFDSMTVQAEDVNLVKKILWSNEVVEVTVRQRRVGPGGDLITPTSVVATNMRLIIVNLATFGLRRDYEVIPYSEITSVRTEQGIISSSVFIRVLGYDNDKGLLKNGDEEGEVDGLNNTDARTLSEYVSKKLINTAPNPAPVSAPDNKLGAYVYCTKCGAKDDASAKFCKNCGAKLA